MSNTNNDTTKAVYDRLTTLLHPIPACVLDIDILPSSLAQELQYSAGDRALGIPKHVLMACFLRARGQAFGLREGGEGNEGCGKLAEDSSKKATGDTQRGAELDAKWAATTVMLLWDPNHTTAVNDRKRYLITRHEPQEGERSMGRVDHVQQELCWTESLLTSPMRKHNKSPTLFTHRLWLLRRLVLPDLIQTEGCLFKAADVWAGELGIVMTAGSKHRGNYYAWNYARDVYALLGGQAGGDEEWRGVVKGSLQKVMKWCFKHPSDVSGWAFLGWSLEQIARGEEIRGRAQTAEGLHKEVQEWKMKLQWKGAAVDAFMRRIERLTNPETRRMRDTPFNLDIADIH